MTRRGLLALAAAVAVVAAAGFALDRWIAMAPLPDLAPEVSVTVLDREGRLLRAYTVAGGRWRLPADVDAVDRGYLAQLVAFEDKRFHDHSGVDPLALIRAAAQFVASGRIVSGGSTLTMQAARLLEQTPAGSFGAKLRQIRLALALERRLTKREILALYLTLAPFGGNIEGVRAASLIYFGKEPARLTPTEAALLVALPQSPEARRPDRHPEAAHAARDRVLARAAARGAITPGEAAAAMADPVPAARHPFSMLAPHLADRLRAAAPDQPVLRLTLDATLQARLEALFRNRAAALPPGLSAALILANHRSGEVLASIGSPGLFAPGRLGHVDMTRAIRSPGSALKPLIYGLAFEAGLAHPESLVEDRPTAFGSYVPQNFDKQFRGTVTARTALQLSLNIPAVTVLDAVGPALLLARLRRAGVEAELPPGRMPGLAIGLGGLGITLRDLVTLYAAIARGGEAVPLTELQAEAAAARAAPPVVLTPGAAWQVADILAGAPVPAMALAGSIAYKTGTSYGRRDAWAIGFDGRHVIGVWVGRPDGAAAPGISGIDTAAPLMFEAFARLGAAPVPLPAPPPDVLTVSNAELPPPLRHLRAPSAGPHPGRVPPEIAFPPDGARVDLGLSSVQPVPLALKVRDGQPPFTWLADGRPVDPASWERAALWRPDGPGFVAITVIDAAGAASRVRVFVE
jgi:penicillin-binding protein 1C